MNTLTISQSKEMIGQPIPRIVGTLTKCYPRKTGEGKYGPWAMQNGLLEDSTGTIAILFVNRKDMSESQGNELTFRCNESKKGLTGVTAEENTYKDQTKPQLKVTASAIILGATDVQAPEQQPKHVLEPSTIERFPAPRGTSLTVSDVEKIVMTVLERLGIKGDLASQGKKEDGSDLF